MSKINFIIVSAELNQKVGGIIALHKLADIIGSFKENSFITSKTFEGSNAKFINNDEIKKLNQDITMYIYPEIIADNPYNAKHVTRWILNSPKKTYSTFKETDLVYVYWKYFILPNKHKVHGELRCFDLKLNIFFNKNEKRSGECFLIKKGARFEKEQNKHSDNSLNLDKFISDAYLVEQFNKKEKFISYDAMTYHSIQAALCGCNSIVIPDPGISKKEWISRCPIYKYGVAYGLEDIAWAIKTKKFVKNNLLNLEKESFILIKNYIKDCYNFLKINYNDK